MDADTAIGGGRAQFPSTQLSLVEAAAAGLGEEARERVIAVYWKPVYRFIRMKFGKNNEDAKDLTQGFFTAALAHDFFARFDPDKASFRTYIRMAVERYAANVHEAEHRQKRGPAVPLEQAAEPASESPEAVFEREWRRQVFALAIEDLQARCESSGKQVQFEIFSEYDLAEDERPSYAELAARHGIAETSVTNYLAWARRTLRELVTTRLRGVTAGERELRQEMRRLWT